MMLSFESGEGSFVITDPEFRGVGLRWSIYLRFQIEDWSCVSRFVRGEGFLVEPLNHEQSTKHQARRPILNLKQLYTAGYSASRIGEPIRGAASINPIIV